MKETKIIKNREVAIDLLETVAILLVITYHSSLYSCDIINENSPLNYIRYLFTTLLSPCVALFFFANGYLLFNRNLNLKKHIMKTLKLIVLCAVWGFIRIVILMTINNELLSIKEIFKILWTFKNGWTNSLWFLGAIVCIWLIFPLLKVVYDNNETIFRYFIVISAIFTFGNTIINESVTIFFTQILHKDITLQGYNFFNIFNPYRGIYGYTVVYFCVGGYIYKFKEKILSFVSTKRNLVAVFVMIISCILLWLVGICYSKTNKVMWDIVWNGYDTIFTFINVICIFVLCLNLKKDYSFIRMISSNTLGVYFIHEILIALSKETMQKYLILQNIPFNILYSVIILLICLGIVELIKKVPFLRKLIN